MLKNRILESREENEREKIIESSMIKYFVHGGLLQKNLIDQISNFMSIWWKFSIIHVPIQ